MRKKRNSPNVSKNAKTSNRRARPQRRKTSTSAQAVSKPSERRGHARVPVDMFMNRFMDGQPYLCVAVDVSDAGMRLRPLSGPSESEGAHYMGLQFQIPGCDDVLTASGERVRDIADGTVAVRFTHVSESARHALRAFVQGHPAAA